MDDQNKADDGGKWAGHGPGCLREQAHADVRKLVGAREADVDDGWDLCCQRAGGARILEASAALCKAAGMRGAAEGVRRALLEAARSLVGPALGEEVAKRSSVDRWYGFECSACVEEGTSGLVFNVRTDAVEPTMDTAKCPRCGAACTLVGSWNADQCGGNGPFPSMPLTEETFLSLARQLDNGEDYAQEMLLEVKEEARRLRGQLSLPLNLEPGPTTSLHGEIEAEAVRLGGGKVESMEVLLSNIEGTLEVFPDEEEERQDTGINLPPRREDLLTLAAWAYLAVKRETDHPGAPIDTVPEGRPVSPDANPQGALPLSPRSP
jgi:hypothetical protein